jgi:methyl-accepting chemotaxis protein
MMLKTKLFLSFGILSVVSFIICMVGFLIIRNMDASVEKMNSHIILPLEEIAHISIAFQRMRINIRDFISANNPQHKENTKTKIAELRETIKTKSESFEKTIISDEGKQLFREFKVSFDNYNEMLNKLIQLNLEGKTQETQDLMTGAAKDVALQTQSLIDKLMENKSEQGRKTKIDDSAKAATAKRTMSGLLIISLVVSVFLGISIERGIAAPISRVVDIARELGRGNFIVDILVDRKDEIGQLLGEISILIDNLKKMFAEISKNVQTVASSSNEMTSIAEHLAESAHRTSDKTLQLAAASEETTTSIQAVAAAMEQSTTNSSMIASATVEMNATVDEIAQNTGKAKSISERAVVQSQTASQRVSELGGSAKKIGLVSETIAEISEQTNLLALNATIEAARAGEAGKGFAVVANEIKELARQTSEATIEIKDHINGIQAATETTISDISDISAVISEISDIISGIAASLEEQAVTTGEISKNITQASQGISEVNENMNQSAGVISEMAKNITEVSVETKQVEEISIKIQANSKSLMGLSQNLKTYLSRYKYEDKS